MSSKLSPEERGIEVLQDRLECPIAQQIFQKGRPPTASPQSCIYSLARARIFLQLQPATLTLIHTHINTRMQENINCLVLFEYYNFEWFYTKSVFWKKANISKTAHTEVMWNTLDWSQLTVLSGTIFSCTSVCAVLEKIWNIYEIFMVFCWLKCHFWKQF